MTVSELIEQLEALRASQGHGDDRVLLFTTKTGAGVEPNLRPVLIDTSDRPVRRHRQRVTDGVVVGLDVAARRT